MLSQFHQLHLLIPLVIKKKTIYTQSGEQISAGSLSQNNFSKKKDLYALRFEQLQNAHCIAATWNS